MKLLYIHRLLTVAMGSSNTSWGEVISATTGTLSVVQLSAMKKNQADLIQAVRSLEYTQIIQHKEKIATNLVSIYSTEKISLKIEKMNQEVSFSLAAIDKGIENISKSGWSILEELQTQRKIREYEGKLFGIIDQMNDELEFINEMAEFFPEYSLVRTTALYDIKKRHKLDISKFHAMEKLKHDMAKKVFAKLEQLHLQLKKKVGKNQFKKLNNAITENRVILIAIDKNKRDRTSLKRESTRLDKKRKQKQQISQSSKEGSELENRHAELLGELEKLESRKKDLSANPSNKLLKFRKELTELSTSIQNSSLQYIKHEKAIPMLAFKFRKSTKDWISKKESLQQKIETENILYDDFFSKAKLIAEKEGFIFQNQTNHKLVRSSSVEQKLSAVKIEEKQINKEISAVKRIIKKDTKEFHARNRQVGQLGRKIEQNEKKIDTLSRKIVNLSKNSKKILQPCMEMLPVTLLLG